MCRRGKRETCSRRRRELEMRGEREEREKGEEGREREGGGRACSPTSRPRRAVLVWAILRLFEFLEISLGIPKNEPPSLAPPGVIFGRPQSRESHLGSSRKPTAAPTTPSARSCLEDWNSNSLSSVAGVAGAWVWDRVALEEWWPPIPLRGHDLLWVWRQEPEEGKEKAVSRHAVSISVARPVIYFS